MIQAALDGANIPDAAEIQAAVQAGLAAAAAAAPPPPPAADGAPPPVAAAAAAAAPPPHHEKLRKLESCDPQEWRLWCKHFDVVALGNNWNDRQKRVAIGSAMGGEAQSRVLFIDIEADGPPGGAGPQPANLLLNQYEQVFLPAEGQEIAREAYQASAQ